MCLNVGSPLVNPILVYGVSDGSLATRSAPAWMSSRWIDLSDPAPARDCWWKWSACFYFLADFLSTFKEAWATSTLSRVNTISIHTIVFVPFPKCSTSTPKFWNALVLLLPFPVNLVSIKSEVSSQITYWEVQSPGDRVYAFQLCHSLLLYLCSLGQIYLCGPSLGRSGMFFSNHFTLVSVTEHLEHIRGTLCMRWEVAARSIDGHQEHTFTHRSDME